MFFFRTSRLPLLRTITREKTAITTTVLLALNFFLSHSNASSGSFEYSLPFIEVLFSQLLPIQKSEANFYYTFFCSRLNRSRVSDKEFISMQFDFLGSGDLERPHACLSECQQQKEKEREKRQRKKKSGIIIRSERERPTHFPKSLI